MARIYLDSLCNVLRTKNAGPFRFTADILFKDARDYRVVVDNGLLTREIVAQAYATDVRTITNFETFDNVSAIKVTMKRKFASGSPGDSDCYGMNQEGPLLQLSFAEVYFSHQKPALARKNTGETT
jgi:hypothetical protein